MAINWKTFSTSASLATGRGNQGWHTTLTTAAAQQSFYACSDSEYTGQRIGIMQWNNLGATMKNSTISSISITLTLGGSGMHNTTKNIQFYTSKAASIDSSVYYVQDTYLGSYCGTASVYGTNTSVSYTFSGSGLTTLINSLTTGINCICIYNSDGSYTNIPNNNEGVPPGNIGNQYCAITRAVISVTYKENTVRVWISGQGWVEAIPYIWVDGRGWVRAGAYVYQSGVGWVKAKPQ